MYASRTARLLEQATKIIATGGTAMVLIRGLMSAHPLYKYDELGEGLIAIHVDENMVVGKLFVFEEDIVAVSACGFQDPA